MKLLENARQSYQNHAESTQEMREAAQDVDPANVAPVLAKQAVARDDQLSFLTFNCWVRASDQHNVSDIPNN